jgi:hypothetical protein
MQLPRFIEIHSKVFLFTSNQIYIIKLIDSSKNGNSDMLNDLGEKLVKCNLHFLYFTSPSVCVNRGISKSGLARVILSAHSRFESP